MNFWEGASMGRGTVVAVAVVIAALFALPAAAPADTAGIIAPQHGDTEDGWQAGSCIGEPPDVPKECSMETPGELFERAGAHPPVAYTQFIVKSTAPGKSPVGELKRLHVDGPVGVIVNPQAVSECPRATFELLAQLCPPDSVVGTAYATVALPPLGVPLAPVPSTLYNVTPPYGEAAWFGLNLAGQIAYLKGTVAYESDYHIGFTVQVPPLVHLEPIFKGAILKARLVFNGRAGDGTTVTTPTTCFGHDPRYSSWLIGSSYQEEEAPGYSWPQSAEPAFESPLPPGSYQKECGTIPFDPSIEIDAGTDRTDSPAPVDAHAEVPVIAGADKQVSSQVKSVVVKLPPGLGLNASAGNGLAACTDAQFGKGTREPVRCPEASKIGTVDVETPVLPPGSVTGTAFVGQQLSRDPASGKLYRIFVDAEAPRYGVSARLIAGVVADPVTGRLTAKLEDMPQVPISSVDLHARGGPRAPLSSPPTCGPNALESTLTPWSGNAPAHPSASMSLQKAPGGGPCAKTMAERPFAPHFGISRDSTQAGAFTPLTMTLARADGEQELKGLDVQLPPGLVGSIRGIQRCSDAALAAAASRGGREEMASPSCPAESRVGTAKVSAGAGPEPFHVEGSVYLAEAYQGAPLSLAVIAPAVAGPFDLGTVVVRAGLQVDPETAVVSTVSDVLPHVFGGAKLDVRDVEVRLDREDFVLNPTSCGPLTAGGELLGGGADPTDPAAFSHDPIGATMDSTGCEKLGFGPKLTTTLLGGRKTVHRAQHPRLRAVLRGRPGDANIGRASLVLPHALFLDQNHIRTICTRVQLAAGKCPPGSIYGRAVAETPLLDEPLEGPVYLTSSDHELPDVLADLHGLVNVRLRGTIEPLSGRIRNVFSPVPDAPVSKVVLTLFGGKRGLLVNSRDLCTSRRAFSFMNMTAQNGKKLKRRVPLRVPACKK
jgi:hypothetical protein